MATGYPRAGVALRGRERECVCACVYLYSCLWLIEQTLVEQVHQCVRVCVCVCVFQSALQSTQTGAHPCRAHKSDQLCVCVCVTGDHATLRLLSALSHRQHPQHKLIASGAGFTYGTHMAISTAASLLFLGGGRMSLTTTPASVAALLIAMYPVLPTSSTDNRCHLQVSYNPLP